MKGGEDNLSASQKGYEYKYIVSVPPDVEGKGRGASGVKPTR